MYPGGVGLPQPTPEPEPEPDGQPAPGYVTEWRRDGFLAAGLNPEMAELLALAQFSLYEFRRLVDRGCRVETAALILL